MEGNTGRKTKKRLFGGVRHSLRAQIGLIVLLSYLIPVVLLGVFTGSFLMKRLENQTRMAVTSGAEQAWTLTEQKIERTLELARDATYDGELTDTWQKWNDGAIGDAEYMRLCRNYLERKYSREQLVSFAACFPVKNPEILCIPGAEQPTAPRSCRTCARLCWRRGKRWIPGAGSSASESGCTWCGIS